MGLIHTLAIKYDGSLWAWGSNRVGQLGDGTTLSRLEPVAVVGHGIWRALALGFEHTVAIKSDGSLWSWGGNFNGQLGDGSTNFRRMPVRIGGKRDWHAVSAGFDNTVALRSDGSLWAWGNYQRKSDSGIQMVATTAPARITNPAQRRDLINRFHLPASGLRLVASAQ